MKNIVWCLMISGALVTGCSGHSHRDCAHDHHDHDHDHGHVHAPGESCPDSGTESHDVDEIIFPAAQAARTEFEVQVVEPSTFSDVIAVSGQILAAQGDEVSLTAPVSGIVSFAGTRMADGSAIARGSNVFYVSSKNIATGDVQSVNAAAYRKAKADLERAESLLAEQIVSQREYDEIRLAYEQARTQYEALSGARSDRGTAVASPIGGYVTSLAVREGDFVEMGQPLASVSQNRRLMLRAEVSQKYYSQLGQLQSASFRAPTSGEIRSLDDLNGRLLSVGKASAGGSFLIPVTFEFDNRGGVVPGSFVEVWLRGTPQSGVIALPVDAVSEQQGVHYIYIQLDEEGYERREVTLGATDGERVRILSGVAPGERVVTKGAVHVRMAAASNAIPHGHTH